MCKLLAVLDIENADDALTFTELAAKPMTSKDDDGIGTIMLGDEGLGVERWLNPADFPNEIIMSPSLSKYQSLIPPVYNTEGPTSQKVIKALGMHSRKATCGVNLQNVHPFVKNGLALIHNGIISNHDAYEKTVSTCDSEAILSVYEAYNGPDCLSNVQAVVEEVEGWYAFMIFSDKGFVDIVKDGATGLYFAHVQDIGTVFCTTQEIIRGTAARMKKRVTECHEFPSWTAIRWYQDGAGIQVLPVHKQYVGKSKDTPPLGISYLEQLAKEDRAVIGASKDYKGPPSVDDDICPHGKRVGYYCKECYEYQMGGML